MCSIMRHHKINPSQTKAVSGTVTKVSYVNWDFVSVGVWPFYIIRQ